MSQSYRVLGEFSKGISGSVSINFARSAGPNCDQQCPHLGHDCYAETLEQRPDRQELANKLRRHERRGAALVCGAALD